MSGKLKVLSLFAGIGGFELGLERAGRFEVVAQCEIDPFCRKILEKHWPHVKRYEDVRQLTADTLARDGITVDVICGGFPCQETSLAAEISGNRLGLDGRRSGLWKEYLRLVREIRPSWVIVENTPGVKKWADEIEAGLEGSCGNVARYERSARDCGAPHRRRRVFFIAHPCRKRLEAVAGFGGTPSIASQPWPSPPRGTWHTRSPRNHRVDDGLSGWVDRLGALGNAVVPQIPELIGRAIMDSMERAA